MRRASTRRMSTRTNTSLKQVNTEKATTKKEVVVNMNAIIIKNLTYANPSQGRNNVYYLQDSHT